MLGKKSIPYILNLFGKEVETMDENMINFCPRHYNEI
jgi:hypothetical protein